MIKMKFFLMSIVSFMIVLHVTGITEKQMWAAVKMVRNVCQPKTKTTNDDIDKMHKGDWNIDHTAKCYLACSMNMYKLLDTDNTLNYEAAKNQLKQLPESYRSSTAECMNKCKDSAVTLDDECVAAYELCKCMYFCNPQKYFLP